MHTTGWIVFSLFVIIMLALDLGIFHKESRVMSFREAVKWAAIWVALAMLFAVGLWYFNGSKDALEFLTGYVIEKSLSVDNIFVFLLIFTSFKISEEYQYRILFWGIIGALIMRAIFIFAGTALISRFHITIYIFGLFLLVTGIKLLFKKEDEAYDPSSSLFYRIATKIFPVTPKIVGQKFFVRENGKLLATPLFIVLVLVEGTDLIFAVDSIPAVLAVTRDPFIVYTSNIFAILGLRAMYFALAGFVKKFVYLHYALAFILSFVGIKMIMSSTYPIPILLSLFVIIMALVIAIFASYLKVKREQV